jgi:hypothetical protein
MFWLDLPRAEDEKGGAVIGGWSGLSGNEKGEKTTNNIISIAGGGETCRKWVGRGRFFAGIRKDEKIQEKQGGPSPDTLDKIKSQSLNQIFTSPGRYVKIIL